MNRDSMIEVLDSTSKEKTPEKKSKPQKNFIKDERKKETSKETEAPNFVHVEGDFEAAKEAIYSEMNGKEKKENKKEEGSIEVMGKTFDTAEEAAKEVMQNKKLIQAI